MALQSRKWIQVLLLLLFLVAIPSMSWVYLNRGLKYRLSAMEELQDRGPLPTIPLISLNGDTLNQASLKGNVTVFSFFDPERDTITGYRIADLHQQFDERWDVKYVLVGAAEPDALLQYAETFALTTDPNQVFFVAEASKERLYQRATNDFHLKVESPEILFNSSQAILADTNAVVRRQYDLNEGPQFVRLIEHTALLMHPQRRRDIIFRRDTEK